MCPTAPGQPLPPFTPSTPSVPESVESSFGTVDHVVFTWVWEGTPYTYLVYQASDAAGKPSYTSDGNDSAPVGQWWRKLYYIDGNYWKWDVIDDDGFTRSEFAAAAGDEDFPWQADWSSDGYGGYGTVSPAYMPVPVAPQTVAPSAPGNAPSAPGSALGSGPGNAPSAPGSVTPTAPTPTDADDQVRYSGQSKTAAEKAVARENIGAVAMVYPTGVAATDTALLQDALDAGGEVRTQPGSTYLISEMLEIGDNTRLVGWRTVFRKNSAFAHILRNTGASTGTTNSRIRISGIRFEANSLGALGDIDGLRGTVSLFHIADSIIEDCEWPDIYTPNWALHLADWSNLFVTRCIFEGNKDGLHLSAGSELIVSLCRFKTYDDAIGMNAHDYPTCSPIIGSISNVLFIGCTDDYRAAGQSGYFCRALTGSWAAWGAYNYRAGDLVTASGNTYVCTSPADGTTKSAAGDTIPSHTTGSVTATSGLVWRINKVGDTSTAANISNITFRDCECVANRTWLRLEWSLTNESRSVYPGTESVSYLKNIRISGGRYAPHAAQDMIAGPGNLLDFRADNCDVSGLSYLANFQYVPGYSNSTDPRAAHATHMQFRGCGWDNAAKYIYANRQSLAVTAVFSGGLSAGGAVTRHTSSTGTVRVLSDSILVSTTGLTPSSGDKVVTSSGPLTYWNSAWRTDGTDESVSSKLAANATITNSDVLIDTGLSVYLPIGTWELTGLFQTSADTGTPGAKFAAVFSGTLNADGHDRVTYVSSTSGGANATVNPVAIGSAFSTLSTGSDHRTFIAPSVLRVTAAGTLKIQFAQKTATVGATTTLSVLSRIDAKPTAR